MIARQKTPSPITIRTTIGEDHRLFIDIPLPADAPMGQVEVELVLRATDLEPSTVGHSALDVAREKLRVAGRLSTAWNTDATAAALSDEALWELVQLPPDAVSSEQLINEDRGSY